MNYATPKGSCHEIENVYNWFQLTDQKNLVLPEHVLTLVDALFMLQKNACFGRCKFDRNFVNDE
jgi:hypothetical protein